MCVEVFGLFLWRWVLWDFYHVLGLVVNRGKRGYSVGENNKFWLFDYLLIPDIYKIQAINQLVFFFSLRIWLNTELSFINSVRNTLKYISCKILTEQGNRGVQHWGGWGADSVLIIYCCITHYPQFRRLKQQALKFSHFPRVRNSGRLSWVLSFTVSQKTAVKMQSSHRQLGRVCFRLVIQWLAGFSSSRIVRLMASVLPGYWASPTWQLTLSQVARESASKWKSPFFVT